MNNRLLEIIKNPDLLVLDDIEILENEISKHPFVQSFRALQLLATHRFNENMYSEKLSKTAAFTTDKKILYQLIHQKEIQENKISEEKVDVSKVEKLSSTPAKKIQKINLSSIDKPKPVYVDGGINRILFEGEENFLNEADERVNLEANQESETLVIASKDDVLQSEKLEILEKNFEETLQKLAKKSVINEEIKTEEDVSKQPSELSFHASAKFLPELKIEIKDQGVSHFIAENKVDKHEAEMKNLIAEVEAKMKNSAVKTVKKDTEIESTWKPMTFEDSDSNFEKAKVEETKNLNIEESAIKVIDNQELSNIPSFINTWKNWLKLESESKVEVGNVKQKAIEIFIEKEPKISKLKEESNFTVKDKGDNISHLMTETLANLYLDQKLYAKAQRAFEILIEKEPEKKEKFTKKLEEIKELRNQK